MPAYTLGEIMSQATWRAGRRADIPASTVSFLANEAYMEVAQLYPRDASERTAELSVTSGVAFVSLPSACEQMIFVGYANSADSLTQLSIDEIESRDTGPGQPTAFAFFGSGLELWPSPSSSWSLSIRYIEQISDMTGLSSVPSLSTPWRAAIIPKLEEKIHNATGNVTGAALAQQRYLSYVGQLKNDMAKRQSTAHAHGVRVQYDEPRRSAGDWRGSDLWERY